MDRQAGNTTRQMKEAPMGAVFVWCNSHVHYPQALSRALSRSDLVVRPMSWLDPRNVMGRSLQAVVVDHAARLDAQMLEALHYLRLRGTSVALS